MAGAGNCSLASALKDPELSQNPAFWEDYAKISGKGEPGEAQMQALIEKYKGSKSSSSAAASAAKTDFKASATYRVQTKAEKEIKSLPKNLHGKVDEFIDLATQPGGIQEIRNNPGRWHYEKLAQFGDNAHSVRLSDGYRILFDYDKDTNHFEIRRVNKGQIHGS
jgi:plasmid maintenance system killer protein